MPMLEYPKIPGPYRRHTDGPYRNQLIVGAWTSPELDYLQHAPWCFTEKVDGTNIRVHWDGHAVTFGGRTDRAQIPATLFEHLKVTFTEELFEQAFGDTEVTLHGEGFGARIQKAGGNYSPDQRFVLFDVRIDTWWLQRDDVAGIAEQFGIPAVPVVLAGTLHDGIGHVATGMQSHWGEFIAEGLVGHPGAGLLDRAGRRISVKIKTADFHKATA